MLRIRFTCRTIGVIYRDDGGDGEILVVAETNQGQDEVIQAQGQGGIARLQMSMLEMKMEMVNHWQREWCISYIPSGRGDGCHLRFCLSSNVRVCAVIVNLADATAVVQPALKQRIPIS